MKDLDFTISHINRVVKRPTSATWKADGLYFEREYIMVIALEGEADYVIEGKPVPAKENDVFIFAPKVKRSGCSNPQKPWAFISVNFSLECNAAAQEFFSPVYIRFEGIGEHIRNKFADIAYAWEGKNPLYQVRCKNLATAILYDLINSQLPHTKVPHPKKLENARTYIQANFKQEINIEALAERLGFSPSYFRKLFKEAYGMAPMQYITNLRISTAQDLLLSGEVNITEAALLSGFDDIYYFSTLFKRQTGYSPSQYIKANHHH